MILYGVEMICRRCGQGIEPDAPRDAVICGSCADDLKQEEMARQDAIEAEERDIAYQMNKEAYEEAQREEQQYTERCR